MTTKTDEFFGEVISCYTINQATDDGILLKVTSVIPEYAGPISHITTNLLDSCGYRPDGVIIYQNARDLLIQSHEIIRKQSETTQKFKCFYVGEIELPSGEIQTVFIEMNELSQFTVLLPEDH